MLELVLAMALSTFIIAALGMAITLTLRSADVRRTNVEEAALARGILQRMAADIRGAVYPVPVEFSGFEELAAQAGVGDAAEADLGEVTDETEPDTETTEDETEVGLTDQNVDIAGTAIPAAKPGLYGNQFELQIDISRPPRIDEYEAALAISEDPLDIVSDVKTVAWYVLPPTAQVQQDALGPSPVNNTGGLASFNSPQSVGGLARREIDRAVTIYASQVGGGADLQNSADVLAPEVDSVEFLYFDGLVWSTFWDSNARGGLPFAVKIRIGIRKDLQPQADITDPDSIDPNGGIVYYDTTVHIPTAVPLEDPTLVPAEETTDATQSGNAASTDSAATTTP